MFIRICAYLEETYRYKHKTEQRQKHITTSEVRCKIISLFSVRSSPSIR